MYAALIKDSVKDVIASDRRERGNLIFQDVLRVLRAPPATLRSRLKASFQCHYDTVLCSEIISDVGVLHFPIVPQPSTAEPAETGA
jgi:hypothetical protein